MKDQINHFSNFWKRISVVIVAINLLSAVLLKSLGKGTNEISLSPAVEMLAMQAEVIVGAWLLIGRLRTISWFVASALFVVLTLVSASSALRGHSDCGCFGPVRVNPWITTCFNFTAIHFLQIWPGSQNLPGLSLGKSPAYPIEEPQKAFLFLGRSWKPHQMERQTKQT